MDVADTVAAVYPMPLGVGGGGQVAGVSLAANQGAVVAISSASAASANYAVTVTR